MPYRLAGRDDRDATKYTQSLGLATFSSQYGSYPGMLMAVTAVMTIPIIILFRVTQRTSIQGITLTGLKGQKTHGNRAAGPERWGAGDCA